MKSFKDYLKERCWSGYKPVPGKKAYSKGSCVKEDGGAGAGAGVASAGPTNVVGGGAIAGTGGKGGEPGVYLKKRKKSHNPVMMGAFRRKPPK